MIYKYKTGCTVIGHVYERAKRGLELLNSMDRVELVNAGNKVIMTRNVLREIVEYLDSKTEIWRTNMVKKQEEHPKIDGTHAEGFC